MVKLDIMFNTKKMQKNQPPKLIESLAAGFNLVTANLHLILFPAVFDLFLWFGPAIRMRQAMLPVVERMQGLMQGINNPDFSSMAEATRVLWLGVFEQFNLLSVLRTYPIGIPSLLAGTSSGETPLGKAVIFEMPSLALALLALIALWLVGILLGSIYFNQVAFASGGKKAQKLSFQESFVQSLLVTVLVWLILIFLTFPVSILLTFLSAFGMNVVQFAMIFIGLGLIWLLMPLVFAAHGIYTEKLNTIRSALTSIKLVRFFVPGSGVFFVTAIVLAQGMDIIWNMPAVNSWVFLVSILGHAFISSSLLAASFIYYRKSMKFMHETIDQISQLQVRQQG